MKRILHFLSHPPKWFIGIVWVFTIFFTCIAIIYIDKRSISSWAIASYCIFPVFIGYTIFTVVYIIPSISKKLVQIMSHNRFTNRIATDYGFRAGFFSTITSIVNVLYALYTLAVAIFTQSAWYGSICAAYFILSLMRFYVVRANRKQLKYEKINYVESWNTFRNVGISLIVYAFAFAAVVAQMVLFQFHSEYAGYLIYGVIGFTIYNVVIAIIKLLQVRRYKNPTWQSLRNITFANALVSLLTLQNSLLAAFADGVDYRPINIVSGVLVCFGIAAMGIYMIIVGSHNKRKYKRSYIAKIMRLNNEVNSGSTNEKNN